MLNDYLRLCICQFSCCRSLVVVALTLTGNVILTVPGSRNTKAFKAAINVNKSQILLNINSVRHSKQLRLLVSQPVY